MDGDVRLSGAELADRAARIAGALTANGVACGDVVGFWLPPWWEALALYAACWRLGAVAAPLHHRLALAEAEALVERLRPRVVLVGSELPQLRGAAAVRGPHDVFARWLESSPAPVTEVAGLAPAVALATSGSSGVPKLVAHTHRGLAYKARLMADVHGLTPNDVILMPAPLGHVSGLLNGLLLPGAAGMTTALMERWSAPDALDLIERERVSFLIGPPTYFVQLMAEPAFSAERVASVRLISCGGAGVTESFARTAAEAFGAVVKRTYGSTEAPTVTTAHAGDPVELGWTTDGRPVGEVELRVQDGELLVRGPELFAGYDHGGGLDADGWFRTGDLASIDTDGWVTISGRRDDTIIRGGENVVPAEVESVCASLPGVRQAVAVGYPDDVMGQRVGLVVVGAIPSVDAVRAHCAAAGLASFKIPDRVVGIDEMPVLTVGKPNRAALTDLLGH